MFLPIVCYERGQRNPFIEPVPFPYFIFEITSEPIEGAGLWPYTGGARLGALPAVLSGRRSRRANLGENADANGGDGVTQIQDLNRHEALRILTAPNAPFELETRQINGYAQRVFKLAPRSLRELYEQTLSDKPFVVYEDERLSFVSTNKIAARVAWLLVHRFGVTKGDRVAIAMRNYPEWILAFQAATSIGAIAVAMNAHWQPDEMAYGLNDCGAKVLFADQERLDRLAQASDVPPLQIVAVRSSGRTGGAPDLARLLADLGDAAMPAAEIMPEDEATIFYTSGSTGYPKGVVASHRSIISALVSWELDLRAGALVAGLDNAPPTQEPATLLAVPLFHVSGSHAAYLHSYRTQRKLVCMYKWEPELAAELIEREKITSLVAPAAVTGDLVNIARKTRRNLSSLLSVGGGGAARAPEQVKSIKESFTNALPGTGWGMTETNAIGTGIGGLEYLARPASSGRCSTVLDLKVVDEKGRELPVGQRGELLVRGASMFKGYWNRPELNATIFSDGWFQTGDIAYFDEEGFLFIVDRIKDIVIRGGENISCGHVEAVLLMHPSVHEVSVYSVPDERLGEELGATVYCDDALEIETLKSFLGQHLARFEIPRYIVKSSTPLPRLPSGKIFKRDVKESAKVELGLIAPDAVP